MFIDDDDDDDDEGDDYITHLPVTLPRLPWRVSSCSSSCLLLYGAAGFPAWGIPPNGTLDFTLEVLLIK